MNTSKEIEQLQSYECTPAEQAAPSLPQSRQLKKRSRQGKLAGDFIPVIHAAEKPDQKQNCVFKTGDIVE